jgi:hypothetical protein
VPRPTTAASRFNQDQGQSAPEETSTPRSREAPEVDGRFTSSCDICLPSGLSGGYAFIGAAKMENVGIVVRVRARWDQVSSANITDEKHARIPVGERRTAKLRVVATPDQISEHQSSPDYYGRRMRRQREGSWNVRPAAVRGLSRRDTESPGSPWGGSRPADSTEEGNSDA